MAINAPPLAPPKQGERRGKPSFADIDFDKSPFIVIWEITQACDLACVHCRAEAQPNRHPLELSTEEGFKLIDQMREFGHPLFVITGGDPLKRGDVFDFIQYADEKGLRVALTPSGTELMNVEVLKKLQDVGLSRLAVSLDSRSREKHDTFRKVDGSFDWTVDMVHEARKIGLPVQINTTITRHNQDELLEMAEFMKELDICLWSVFFLVPTGRAGAKYMVSARKHEEIFNQLYDLSKEMPYDIKTTAAQHYRRVVMQRRAQEAAEAKPSEAAEEMEVGGWSVSEIPAFLTGKSEAEADASKKVARAAKGVNDGNGFVFISHTGEVFPSGFLPASAGNVRKKSLVDIYRNSDLFKRIREYGQIKGKCGVCDFRDVCGGSRSRAYGVYGDVLASDPYCSYIPPAWKDVSPEEKAWHVQYRESTKPTGGIFPITIS